MKYKFLILWAVFGAMACTEKKDIKLNVQETETDSTSYVIPKEKALANLSQVLELINPEREERGLHRLNVTEAKDFLIVKERLSQFRNGDKLTKSTTENKKDTSLYIVNFGHDKGYAILAADRRLQDDVLAITYRGSISLEQFYQENQNPYVDDSIGWWNEVDQEYYHGGTSPVFTNKLIKDFTQLKKNDKNKFADNNSPTTYPYYKEWTNDTTISKVLTQTKWEQDEPYNNKIVRIITYDLKKIVPL